MEDMLKEQMRKLVAKHGSTAIIHALADIFTDNHAEAHQETSSTRIHLRLNERAFAAQANLFSGLAVMLEQWENK